MNKSILPALNAFKEDEPLAVELLSNAYENNRFSHAYIFSGSDSEKVINFVRAFAKILLCDSKSATDNCLSCRVFDSGQHPDFRVWAPGTVPGAEKSKFIKLEQVHELIEANQRHPVTSKHKVLVLEGANMLRQEGSNSLLKTLEEPNHFTTIILTVDSLDNVVPTILSRCQIIPVKSSATDSGPEEFDLESCFPSSYKEAGSMALKHGKMEKEDLADLLLKIQSGLWAKAKDSLAGGGDLQQKVELLEKLEKYLKCIESHVNLKILLENLFIDLYEARGLFFRTK
jgi:DNA polymerase III delta prime subunit